MIAHFPVLYPDELVYSWFCRYYVHSGSITNKMAMQELYCKQSDDPSKEFIGNLNKEARVLIYRLCPPDVLVLKHTMYPQYARFIPLEERRAALHRLGHESCDAHHLFCILPRSEGEQYLRFCPLCAEEDRREYGETYWHRKHQIRNMSICPKHTCRLEQSNIPAKSEQSDVFYPAETNIHVSEITYEHNPLEARFSSFLEMVFDSPVDLKNSFSISAVLFQAMRGTRYLMPSGKSRYTQKLSDDMHKYYGGLGLRTTASMNQIQRVLLGSRFDFSVVCQIAFFLGMTAGELTAPSLPVVELLSDGKRDVSPVDWERMDAETAPVLETYAKDVYSGKTSENGRPERVSERLVYREMHLLRHQLENMPRCRAIYEKYTEPYPELWARRLIWAYRKLELEAKRPITWSDIRALTGVKRENTPAAIPYLWKHAEQDVADQLVRLFTKCS